jgi:hypothetical protein
MSLCSVAWIIAVEEYAGTELNIKQPVGLWALELAELMYDRGVEKIILSTSLSNKVAMDPRLQLKGVVRTGAKQADIQDALDLIRGEGVLLLYWVGHGIMAPSRQLICADSKSSADLRTISADSLLSRLRSQEYPRLQYGFFDCCAQVMMMPPAALNLRPGDTPTRQFFYHAASAGEMAAASIEEVGFSRTVLQALKTAETFPPSVPARFLEDLKTSLGRIPLQTRPFLLQRTEESGDVWSSDAPGSQDDIFEAANVAGLARSQFEYLWHPVRSIGLKPVELARSYADKKIPALVDKLRIQHPMKAAPDLLERAASQLRLQLEFDIMCLRLRLLFQDWLAIYDRVAAESPMDKPARIEDLPRLLLSALDQSGRDSGIRSFLKIIELARRRALKQEPQACEQLYKKLAKHGRLATLYAKVVEDIPSDNNPLFLLLAVDWDHQDQSARLTQAWIFPNDHGGFDPRDVTSRGNFADSINVVVQKVIEEFPERHLSVELMAPNELLCSPRELLELVDVDLETCTWLEAQHPITLRWHDRMKGGDKYFQGSWVQAGRATRARADRAERLLCIWIPEETEEINEFHIVGLSFPGPCPSNPRRNRQQFFTELLKGAPYMCWPRESPENISSFRNAASALFAKTKLTRLPHTLRESRAEPSLWNLILLIDEPDRNPYHILNRLTETGQRGAS